MSIEAGRHQRYSALLFFCLIVEDFPQAKTAYESVGVHEAAAGAVVGSGTRRWDFCFRRGGRGREEPCQIGQGVEDLHGVTFLSFRFFTGK